MSKLDEFKKQLWVIEGSDFLVSKVDRVIDGKIYIRANSLRVAIEALAVFPSKESAERAVCNIKRAMRKAATEEESAAWKNQS